MFLNERRTCFAQWDFSTPSSDKIGLEWETSFQEKKKTQKTDPCSELFYLPIGIDSMCDGLEEREVKIRGIFVPTEGWEHVVIYVSSDRKNSF